MMGKEISLRIKELLKLRGMNQNELACNTQISKSAISKYVNGTREPSGNNLIRIATALDTTTDYLLGYKVDNRFQKIKGFMIEELDAIEHCVIYSCYIKKSLKFSQELKEETYITLLRKIVEAIDVDVNVVFDTFNKRNFEESIVSSISKLQNVNSIESCDSQLSPGLQYVDNLCSIYRHYLSGTDKNNFFEKIRNYVKIV